jgi:hypothetical protein
MALNEAVRRRRRRGASWSRSRTTSDFEIFRRRDSSSMSATNGSGNRTVRVFMRSVYTSPAGVQDRTDDQRNPESREREIETLVELKYEN